MGLKFRNPKLNTFLKNNIYKMSTLWSSEVNKEQAKVAVGLWLYACMLVNFLRNKICANKLSSRNSTLYKFLIEIYLESLASSYHFIIYLESSTEAFSATWISHWNSDSSVKSSISGQFYLQMPLGSLVYLSCVVWHIAFHFSR